MAGGAIGWEITRLVIVEGAEWFERDPSSGVAGEPPTAAAVIYRWGSGRLATDA